MPPLTLPPRYVPLGGSGMSGGMGETAHCLDQHLERPVLIKTLKPGTDSRRLRDEVAALAEVRSKHVVELYDVIVDANGEVIGLVEEYLAGSDLPVASIQEEQLFFRTCHSLARGIADIHAHGVVHRDIKPNNMKFDAEGCLKIYDFGLARFNGNNSHTIYIVGTPGYMAPELLNPGYSGGFSFDAAVDVYAFAVTVSVLVNGSIPQAGSACASSFPFSLPSEMQMLLSQCLASNPAARPSMESVANCFKKYLIKDRHRALVSTSTKRFIIDAKNKVVNVNSAGRGSFRLEYDGLVFRLLQVAGDVYVNNRAVASGFELPGSCVIVLGNPTMGSSRISIPVDVSHPEVAV